MKEKKLSKAQTDLLQILKDNPDVKIFVYQPVRGAHMRAFVSRLFYSPLVATVNKLHELELLDKQTSEKRYREFTYTLSEKGKNYGS